RHQGGDHPCVCVAQSWCRYRVRWPSPLAARVGKARTSESRSLPPDLAEWNIDIEPSGAGLPPGSGTAEQGAAIFADSCALCHGDGGKGGVFLGKGAPAAPAL